MSNSSEGVIFWLSLVIVGLGLFAHIHRIYMNIMTKRDNDKTKVYDVELEKDNEKYREKSHKLNNEHLDYFRKRLFAKINELFSEVMSGKAKLAVYYTLNIDETEKEAYFTVERVSDYILYINIVKEEDDNDYYKIHDSYDTNYIYIKTNHCTETADVMILTEGRLGSERKPDSLYCQNYYNDIADNYFGNILRDGLYLKEYLTEDGTKIQGRNQPVLKSKIQTKYIVKDYESTTLENAEIEN